MDTTDLLKQASSGSLKCPKCGAGNMSLKNVRVAMSADGPKLDPNTYAECGACGHKVSIDALTKGGSTGKSWWQFWK